MVELRDPARDLLAERHRHGVLQVRAADLDDVGELLRLPVERVAELADGRDQAVRICSTAAMCIAVGKVSLEDWLLLTSSLGWTGFFEPSTPPRISIARLEMTSLAFMLVCVPLPVCQTESGKWSSSLPSMTSSAARMIASAFSVGERAAVAVDHGRRLLEDAERADQLPREALVADAEVVERPLGLRAPVAVGGDLDRPHRVGLGAGLLRVVRVLRSTPSRRRRDRSGAAPPSAWPSRSRRSSWR